VAAHRSSGGSGVGTAASPYVGATQCLIPFGSSIESQPYSFYTVQPADTALPDQRLSDTATLNWNNTCTASIAGCETGTESVLSRSSAIIGTGSQSVAFHGIIFTKDCASPAVVLAPYSCSYSAVNNVDTAGDTLRISSLNDQVHAIAGDINSGNILPSVRLVFTGPVACSGGSGAGTSASPYVGATACLLPFGTSIRTQPFTFYTVQPGDLQIPLQRLNDVAALKWNNTCTVVVGDCTTDANFSIASAIDPIVLATNTFLGLVRPLAESYRAGKSIDVRFRLGDSAGDLLSDADALELAGSCGVTVTLDDLAPVCASYVRGNDRFRAKLDTPKDFPPGDYPLTIAVGGQVVDTETITITPS